MLVTPRPLRTSSRSSMSLSLWQTPQTVTAMGRPDSPAGAADDRLVAAQTASTHVRRMVHRFISVSLEPLRQVSAPFRTICLRQHDHRMGHAGAVITELTQSALDL